MLSNGGMRAARAALLVLVSVAAACADDAVELALAPTCQPLFAGTECLLPYPSDFFLVPDPSLPSGRALRVQLPAKPIIVETKASVDPNDNWTPDGYSTLTPIVTVLGSPVDPSSVVRVAAAPGDTASPTSHSLILDTTTGQLVPHFVDLDGRATDPARQALVLHPLSPLEPERRYVVALRGVLAPGGALAGTPEGFRRLRDGDLRGAPPLAAIADRYEAEVFAPLAALGVPRGELQLAWSFTTGSRAPHRGPPPDPRADGGLAGLARRHRHRHAGHARPPARVLAVHRGLVRGAGIPRRARPRRPPGARRRRARGAARDRAGAVHHERAARRA